MVLAACAHTTSSGGPVSPGSSGATLSPPAILTPTPSPSPATAAPTKDPGPSTAPTRVPTPSPSTPQSPAASPVPGQPQTVTQANGGQTITLALGTTAQLQLGSGLRWSMPVVTGPAITLTPDPIPTGATYQAWTIAAVRAGQATIRSGGAPICGPGQACPQFIVDFSVTILVP